MSHLVDFKHDGVGSNGIGVARRSLVFIKCSGFILPTKQFPQSFAIFVLPSRVQGTIWYAPTCNFVPVKNLIVIEKENLLLSLFIDINLQ